MINEYDKKYDSNTYWGRVNRFKGIFSIRNLFYNEKQMAEFRKTVQDTEAGQRPRDHSYYKALFALESCYHPDTGEKILLPFRMASFVPTNLIVTAGMLYPASNVWTVIGWQFANQCVNSLVNGANANKSNLMSPAESTMAFLGAAGTSCLVAYGTRQIFQKLTSGRTPSFMAQGVMAMIAVSAANVFNVGLTGYKNMRDGIDVKTEDGTAIGKSNVAGFKALQQVAASRIFTAVPVLIIPSFVLSQLPLKSSLGKSIATLGLVAASLWGALPLALAAFKQNGSIPVSKLEPRFHSLKDKNGNPINLVYYNKGL